MEIERVSRRKSAVWNHFRESKDRRKAECYHCNQLLSIACGSLGNLNRHLRIKHGLTLNAESTRSRAPAGRALLGWLFGPFLVDPGWIPVCEVCYLKITRQQRLQTEVADIASYGPANDGLDSTMPVVNIVEVRSIEETAETDDSEQAQDGLKKLTTDMPVVLAEATSLHPLPSEIVKKPRPHFNDSVDRAKNRKIREKEPDVDVDDDKFMSYFLKSKKQEFQEADEMDLFFRSMCQTTKKMPLLYQIRVKKQIMNVVSEAEEQLAESTPGSERT